MTRAHVLDGIRYLLLVVLVGFVGWALWTNWDEVSAELWRVPAGSIALAFGLLLTAPLTTMLGWRTILADLGTNIHVAPGASLFWIGQLGKYVPGSVWTIVAQAEMGARLAIPRRRMAVTGLLTVGLGIVAGAWVGVPALAQLIREAGVSIPPWSIGLVMIVIGVLLWPRLLNYVIALMLRILRREPLEHDLSGRAIAIAFVWFVLAWVASGLAVFVLARALAPGLDQTWLLWVCICGYALAGISGMLSFLLPAGAGVREAIVIVLLNDHMPTVSAYAIVIIARFLTVVVDIVVAGGGWLWGRAHHLLGEGSVVAADVVVDVPVERGPTGSPS